MVLVAKLSSFPFSRDYISVWKRTAFVDIDDSNYSIIETSLYPVPTVGDHQGEDRDLAELETNSNFWADIPQEEQISEFAAPAFSSLIR